MELHWVILVPHSEVEQRMGGDGCQIQWIKSNCCKLPTNQSEMDSVLCSAVNIDKGGPGEIKLQFSLQFISIFPSVITTIGVILPFLPTKYFVSSVLSSDRSIITSVSIVSREKDDVFLKVLMDCWMRNFWIIWKQTIYPEYIYADKGLNLNT